MGIALSWGILFSTEVVDSLYTMGMCSIQLLLFLFCVCTCVCTACAYPIDPCSVLISSTDACLGSNDSCFYLLSTTKKSGVCYVFNCFQLVLVRYNRFVFFFFLLLIAM